MKLCKFFIFLFVLSCGQISADNKSDSLYKLLSKNIPDTVRIDAYNELCWPVYAYLNVDSSLKYGECAVALSSKIHDTIRLIIAYRRIGIAYTNRADHKNALLYQQKSY